MTGDAIHETHETQYSWKESLGGPLLSPNHTLTLTFFLANPSWQSV